MIGVDWGSTNFRAFRIDSQGSVVETRTFGDGILNIPNGSFQEVLLARVGDWIKDGESHLLLSGMIGSRQGWLETNYLDCPVATDQLANSVSQIAIPGVEAVLVPGVKATDDDGVPEVMRGEEVEIVGVLFVNPNLTTICLPGTHSKWARIKDRKLQGFRTFMTGDVFRALCSETILSKAQVTEFIAPDQAFDRGVHRSAEGGGLLHHVFGVRTLGLMNLLKNEEAFSYLSGLLIGHEVRTALTEDDKVHLVGNAGLCALYARAIEICGGSSVTEEDDAAAKGHVVIARSLGWI